jgi:hypothetical protein
MNFGEKRSRSLIWAADIIGVQHPTIRQWISDGHFRLSKDDRVGGGTHGSNISSNTVRRLAHFSALRSIGIHAEQAGKLCKSVSDHPAVIISAWDFRDAKNVKFSQGSAPYNSPYIVKSANILKLREHVEAALGESNASN